MKNGMCKLNLHILQSAGSHSGYFHTMIPASSCAGTKTTPGKAICMMTSFYYYDQNPSGVCFLVQIKTFVVQTSLRLPKIEYER